MYFWISYSKSGAKLLAIFMINDSYFYFNLINAFIVPSKFLSRIARKTAIDGIITSMLFSLCSNNSTIFKQVSRTFGFF